MSEQIVRTERHMEGNKAIQKTTYSDGSAEALGGLLGLAAISAVLLWPFALLLWTMYEAVVMIRQMGGHPLVGILLAVILVAAIVLLFLRFRPFRYVYIFLNATVIASLAYYSCENGNLNFASILAAILFLGAMVGGVTGERYLENEGLEALRDWISEVTGQQT